ncbi:MAG: carboxymuconolactone decarboxylase family protein [Betaproteobacteria bacterium]
MTMREDESFARGRALLQEYLGKWDIPRDQLDASADLLISHLFGEIWTREGLTLRERSLITLATLIVQGAREQEFKFHVKGALNTGIEPKAIEEMFIHLANYAGAPTTRAGWDIVKPLLDKHSTRN